jgi:hypothetical protein
VLRRKSYEDACTVYGTLYTSSDTAKKLRHKYSEAYNIVPVRKPIISRMGRNGNTRPISHPN